jgi:hypothetical protein
VAVVPAGVGSAWAALVSASTYIHTNVIIINPRKLSPLDWDKRLIILRFRYRHMRYGLI